MSAGQGPAEALGAAIEALSQHRDLGEDEAAGAMGAIMSGEAGEARTAAFLAALRAKGETEEEISGVAKALRSCMVRVRRPAGVVVDTCGTGGDGLSTFNVSTAVAFVVAGAGVTVAKHGNRSASSRCGSADVLTALGVPFLEDPEDLARALVEHRLAFLHAPHLHPAMRHAAPVRRALGIRTVLNLCGPLANPAGVVHQLLGVPDAPTARLLARVLRRLGSHSAWVVTGEEGMDELSVSGPSLAVVLKEGRIEERRIDPQELGIPEARIEDIIGGSPQENAARIVAILGGRRGPDRDLVILNAAAALVVAGTAPGLAEGLPQAARSLDSGAAAERLERLRALVPGGAAAPLGG